MRRLAFVTLAATVASSLLAQSNTVPGLDGRLTDVNSLTYWGRRGAAHPNGEAGMSMLNTMCNPGSVNIPWQAPMQANHPMFGFIIMRESNGRFMQISDWSYCKHAFTSVNVNGACGTCQNPGTGQLMGLNCSDTYGAGNNGDRTYLGPPAEIDPWLGMWNPVGSYFDKGDPEVAAPANADGARSTITTGGDAVKNRVTVKEQDLLTAGTFYYGIQLIHRGEAVANRGDNLASRGFTPSWSGTQWSFSNSAGQQYGSILTRWSGATVNSATNGNDDGRIFVASKVTATGPTFHYEYAVHNVDSNRGIATFRIPVDAGATVSGFGFRDIDGDALNNWTGTRIGNEIVFTAPANNPQNWNTVFNCWFDCSRGPSQGIFHCDAARIGAGGLTTSIPAEVPSGIPTALNTSVGTGCGGQTCAQPGAFYESFGTGTFDLNNSGITMTLNGGTYAVGNATAAYVAPSGTATNLNMGDDTESTITLPFAMPLASGGTTNQIVVCSNGFASPAGNGNSWQPSSGSLLSGAYCWYADWKDLNPTTGGSVRWETIGSTVYVTWLGVFTFGTTNPNTFQMQFESNGNVHTLWQTVNAASATQIVGWSRGGVATSPGNRDISATRAAGWTVCGGAGTPSVSLDASARPVLGTTITMTTSNIPAGSAVAALLFTPTIPANPISLDGIGMTNCLAYIDPVSAQTFNTAFAPGSSWGQPLSLPLDPFFVGVSVGWQSVTFSPGANPAGIASSNGIITMLAMQ